MFQIITRNFSEMKTEKRSRFALNFLAIAVFLLVQAKISLGQFRPTPNIQGQWKILLNSSGVVAMHMALTHQNTVLMLDQIGPDNAGYLLETTLNGTRCVGAAMLRDTSCYAHSVEYDIAANTIRPLRVKTNTFCSSGSFVSSGTLVHTGGNGKGSKRIRYFRPCNSSEAFCDWIEARNVLHDDRWYATNQLLPDNDRIIVVGGRRAFTYEFVPKHSQEDDVSFALPFLTDRDTGNSEGSNYYPFLHLSSDGNLFIFANRHSILFNYRRNTVVKTFPIIPGKGERTYPSTGSSVILPLDHTDNFTKVEVLICGGAAMGAETAAQRNGTLLPGLRSCGRMVITGNTSKWNMESMPGPRLLHNMIILPNGHVIIINGAQRGCAGWNNAGDPALEPYLYSPKRVLAKRFNILKRTVVARMYHSSAVLLPNGDILVAGSNPNNGYAFRDVPYPTELRLQSYTPYYMEKQPHEIRPKNVSVQYHSPRINGVKYGDEFNVTFSLRTNDTSLLEFTVYAQTFTAHSISMNQRMLKLRSRSVEKIDRATRRAVLVAPPSANVAPSGYYMLSVVNDGIPSYSTWVRFLHR